MTTIVQIQPQDVCEKQNPKKRVREEDETKVVSDDITKMAKHQEDNVPTHNATVEGPYQPFYARQGRFCEAGHNHYQYDCAVMAALGQPVTPELDARIPLLSHYSAYEKGPIYQAYEDDAKRSCEAIFPPGYFDKLSPETFWCALRANPPLKPAWFEKDITLSRPTINMPETLALSGTVRISDVGIYQGKTDQFESRLGDKADVALKSWDVHALDWTIHQIAPNYWVMNELALNCLRHRLPQLGKALSNYISYGFWDINDFLRHDGYNNQTSSPTRGTEGFIQQAIFSLPRLTQPATVYRALNKADWLWALCQNPGDEFVVKGFVSTSAAPRFVHKPSGFDECEVWMEIRLPVGTPCLYACGANDEYEWLLPHLSRFRLESKNVLALDEAKECKPGQTVTYVIMTLLL